MNDKEIKTYSMSIRVSQEELDRIKRVARIESYSSYSEFVRRTVLIEANEVITRRRPVKKRKGDSCLEPY